MKTQESHFSIPPGLYNGADIPISSRTADAAKESGIDVTRPDSETAQQQNRVGILIAISDKNEIWINIEYSFFVKIFSK